MVCLDTNNKCTLMLENNGCEPIHLEQGQELGQLVGVALHVAGNPDNGSTPSVNSMITGSLVEMVELFWSKRSMSGSLNCLNY